MTTTDTINTMARVLADLDIALSDFTASTVLLAQNRFTVAEIRDHLEDAVYMARVRRGNQSIGGFIRMVSQAGRRA